MNPAKFCKQKAVYWALSSMGSDGVATYAAPIEVKVRWDEELVSPIQGVRRQLDFVEQTTRVDTQVLVDRKLEEGGLMKLAELADLSEGYSPHAGTDGVYEIMGCLTNPTIDGKKFVYRVVFT